MNHGMYDVRCTMYELLKIAGSLYSRDCVHRTSDIVHQDIFLRNPQLLNNSTSKPIL